MVEEPQQDLLAAVSSSGRLLIFPVAELPRLARGKGNKILNIPSTAAAAREELLVALQTFSAADTLVVNAGRQHLKLKGAELDHYRGERGRRGQQTAPRLPAGGWTGGDQGMIRGGGLSRGAVPAAAVC